MPKNPLRMDPSRTTVLRNRYAADMSRRFNALSRDVGELIAQEDALGLLTINTRWAFETNEQKLRSFRGWLLYKTSQGILASDAVDKDRPWTASYVYSAYLRGVDRAATDTGANREQLRADMVTGAQSLERLRMLYTRSFEDLEGVTQQMSLQISKILALGLMQGQNPRNIARTLQEQVGLSRNRAETIARTEIIHVHAQAQLDSFKAMGLEEVSGRAEWLTAGDNRVCARCSALDGRTFPIERAYGMIPLHPRCVLGESIVDAPDAVAATKTHYTGQIVKLITAKGRSLAVTKGHILLTEHGFIPAEFVYEGLNLVETPAGYGSFFGGPDDHRRKPCIADVFASLSESGGMATKRVPVTPEDFHGDGQSCDSEVEIVWTDGFLQDNGPAHVHGDPIELGLVPFQVGGVGCTLRAQRAAAFLFKRYAAAADGGVGCFRESLAMLRGRLLHSQIHRLAAVSMLDSPFCQSVIDDPATQFELLGNRFNTPTVLEEFNDQIIGGSHFGFGVVGPRGSGLHVSAANRHPGLDQVLSDRRGGMGQIHRQFVDACPSGVSFDQIVNVQIDFLEHIPVYDLSTESTIYSVNGIITSNCRCCWQPVWPEDEEQTQRRNMVRNAILQSAGRR